MFDAESMHIPPLSPDRVSFSNDSQAEEFLEHLLDDTVLHLIANDYAFGFWLGIVASIVAAAMVHLLYWVTMDLRMRRAAKGQNSGHPTEYRIRSPISATTRFLRGLTYLQTSPQHCSFWIKIPPIGTILLLLVYLGFVLALEFADDTINGAQFWQARSIRAGWLAVAQMPLIIVLVGKKNWISLVTGISYERLNLIHRWASRMMLLLAVLHFAFQAYGWSQYPGIFRLEWTTDKCIPTGLAAFVLLIWMNVSTIAPLRNVRYEIFVVQHIVTFVGLIVAVIVHLPTSAISSRIYIYVPVGLYILDRLLRTTCYIYNNIRPSTGTLTKLPGNVTKIRTRCATIKSWRPGSHALLSFPALGIGQSHPATIASSPHSHGGDLIFILKGRQGFTDILSRQAEEIGKTSDAWDDTVPPRMGTYRILLDGPYGGQQAEFAAYDSICLIAGSTGITFIQSLLFGVAHAASATDGKLPLRRVHVVWAVKAANHLQWAENDLDSAAAELHKFGIETTVSFFVTSAVPCEPLVLTTDLGVPERRTEIGRPQFDSIVEKLVTHASGECAIAVCGPLGMSMDVRNSVACLAIRSTFSSNMSKHSVHLHVEGFAY